MLSFWKKVDSDCFFLLAPALLGFILCLPYLSGNYLLADDAYTNSLPTLVLQNRILKEGMWPHWILNAGLGQPWGLMPAALTFYPIQIIWGFLFGWSVNGYLFFILFHLTLGGYLAAKFAEKSGLLFLPSLFFALSFMGNGYVIGYFSNPCLTIPYFWWPLLGIGLMEFHDKEKNGNIAIVKTSIALFLMKTSAYPLFMLILITATFTSYYLMVRKKGTWFQGPKWKLLFIASLISLLLSFPDILMNLESLDLSDRLANKNFYDQMLYHNVSNPLQFVTLLIPTYFLGRMRQLGIYWLERSWWIGTFTLIMIFVGIKINPKILNKYKGPALVAFFFLLISFGGHSFVLELTGTFVKILESFRHYSTARIIPMVFLCYLGAEGFNLLQKKEKGDEPSFKFWQFLIAWMFFLLFCGAAAFFNEAVPNDSWIHSLVVLLCLLIAYSAYLFRFHLSGFNWPLAFVVIQLLTLADIGYQFKNAIGKRMSQEEIRALDESFRSPFSVEIPKQNVRQISGPYHGNEAILNGYVTPVHKWLSEVIANRETIPLLLQLVSCHSNLDMVAKEEICNDARFTIDYYFGNKIIISGEAEKPTFMVVHDFYHPYWTASLNGQLVPILQASNYFKSVKVPKGNWILTLEYVNPKFPLIWIFPFLGVLLLGLCSRKKIVSMLGD